MSIEVGTAKYESTGRKNYFNFKKGVDEVIVRILPPLGPQVKSGKWAVYHAVEFGYKGTDGKMKPFLSPRVVNFNTKMVEVESEAHLKRQEIKKGLEDAKKSGNEALKKRFTDMSLQFNLDSKYHLNVVDLDGKIGLLKLGTKAYKALKKEIDDLRKDGVDPLSVDNGRFFVISRQGYGLETEYYAKVYERKVKASVNGQERLVSEPVVHELTSEVISTLGDFVFDLENIYPVVTPEQEYRIVHEGAQAVDEILGRKINQVNEASVSDTKTTTQDLTNQEQVSDSELSDESFESKLAKEDFSETPTQESISTSNVDLANMSDEDFLKMMRSSSGR